MSALSCARCGASLRAEDGTSVTRCAYCGTEAALAPQVLEEARQYGQQVAGRLAQAEEQAQLARGYAQLTGGNFGANLTLTPGVAGATCSSCGAASRFQAGAMLARCEYCGASLVASATTQSRGLSAAARAARTARLEALKAERYFARGLSRRHAWMASFGSLWVVLVPALAALAFAQSEQPRARENALFFAIATPLVVLVLAAIGLWKRAWHERAENAVRQVARSSGGDVLPDLRAVVDWMNTHWADEFYVYDLSGAGRSHAARGQVRGFEALAFVNPLPKPGTPFLDLLLSAWYDGRSERGEGPAVKGERAARKQLEELGFTLRSGPSGIVARLHGDESRRRLKSGVDLVAALDALARLATSQGGRPQTP